MHCVERQKPLCILEMVKDDVPTTQQMRRDAWRIVTSRVIYHRIAYRSVGCMAVGVLVQRLCAAACASPPKYTHSVAACVRGYLQQLTQS